MDSDEDEVYNDPDPKKHDQFLNDVLSLNKRPQLKKPSRTEPTLQISEFNLVKSVTGKQGGVRLNDLTKVLKQRSKHVEISKKITNAGHKAKTLPKPLEKPQAQRIKRTVAFENVKKQLDRWDAVVTSNRASNHAAFPLPTVKLETGKTFSGFRLKTDLQKELEALEPKVEVFNLEKQPEYPLTMQEMLQRRKEMAKMRAVQSYKEAKARRQSKIKSKKYHRIQRRDKIKQQMKEFEQLQKSDPAEALKKLEEIERVRVEERASLRHRSTGKWARNKQVQAKYDKDSRQVLAQQLALSRDLTQKVKHSNESESEEETTNNVSVPAPDENNPWTNPIHTSSEVDAFLSGYRKFWENEGKKTVEHQSGDTTNISQDDAIVSEKNLGGMGKLDQSEKELDTVPIDALDKIETLNPKPQHDSVKETNKLDSAQTELRNETNENLVNPKQVNESIDEQLINETPSNLKQVNQSTNKQSTNKRKKNPGNPKQVNQSIDQQLRNKTMENPKNLKQANQSTNKQLANKTKETLEKQSKNKKRKKSKQSKIIKHPRVGTTKWEISVISDDSDDHELDDIFDNLNDKLQQTVNSKYNKLKRELDSLDNDTNQKPKKKSKPQKVKDKVDLSFSLPPTRPVIDEELNVTEPAEPNKNSLAVLNEILKDTSRNATSKKASVNNIDPNDVMKIKTKPVNLDTEIPDLLSFDDNEENVNQKGTISEAFEDDDIVEEFSKEKKAEIEGEKPKDINLTLPGWGSWGGTGIRPSKRKNRRFLIKFPKKFKRRDDNKGHLIINEKANAKIKGHMVSELPFPFKKVKDFEASVRAPIGNTFVPETAFRRNIKPAVRTKMGTIIEPMTEEMLLKKKK